MQRRRGAQNDEKRDEVGKRHADDRVDLDPTQMLSDARRRGRPTAARLLFFQTGLPEKKIGTDRRPEKRDDHEDRIVRVGPGG